MTDQEDISESWQDLVPAKAVEPMAQIDPTAPGVSELTDDFLEIQGAPKEFFYVCKGSYGLKQMGIQRYRCVGLSTSPGNGRRLAYVGLPEEVIWAGPDFKVNTGKKYRWSKDQVALTLEDAYKMLDEYRARHIAELETEIARVHQHILDEQKHIENMTEMIQKVQSTPYPINEGRD
jgi:hypothetical protein